MTNSNTLLSPGTYFVQGNFAVAEGAITAGMRFFAGYPITPTTEITERLSQRLPQIGGYFLQMEDEIASIMAIIGASLTGLKAMTATSGPGLNLMNESIGYAFMAEVPIVIAQIMRGGPSTGLPTAPSQADVMMVRWGTHGDHEIIALAPSSVQEMFDYTIDAFNFAELYRVPTFLVADEIVAHMRERLIIPPYDEVKKKIVNRKRPSTDERPYPPYRTTENDLVPPMVHIGEGHRIHITGLTHNEYGIPIMDQELHGKLVKRLNDKIRRNHDKIVRIEEFYTDDADILIVTYGSLFRTAITAVNDLRREGVHVGLVKLITIWPFPDKEIAKIAEGAKGVLIPELNYIQLGHEVERAVKPIKVEFMPRPDGSYPTPNEIKSKVREML